jgi:hypothetical protein
MGVRTVNQIILVVAALMLLPVAVQAQEPQAAPKSVSCINLRDIDSTDVQDDKTIIFKMRGKKYYKNDLSYRCHGLGFAKAFSMRTHSSQLCSIDIIRVLENYGGSLQEGAGCGLGKFVEYTPPAKKPKDDRPRS